jgi:hypothetical protein
MHRDTRKSKTNPGEPVLTIRSEVEHPGTPRARLREWAELTQPMSGALEGRVARIRFELVGGVVHVGTISYEAATPQPIGQATNRALRDLRLGDVPATAEQCLRNMATLGAGLDWLQAFESSRKRAGRRGVSDQTWAVIAARRIEAEQRAPRKAIRYMLRTWPDTFTSESSAHSKVNEAKSHGMLEHGPDGLRLTAKAQQYLENGASK